MTTLNEVITTWAASSGVDGARLVPLMEALVAREDNMADDLRLNGMQFGLEPAIVAEVLAAIGLGRPLSTEERAQIHNQFHLTMERLRRELGGDTT